VTPPPEEATGAPEAEAAAEADADADADAEAEAEADAVAAPAHPVLSAIATSPTIRLQKRCIALKIGRLEPGL
jgi:hypothetical protein